MERIYPTVIIQLVYKVRAIINTGAETGYVEDPGDLVVEGDTTSPIQNLKKDNTRIK